MSLWEIRRAGCTGVVKALHHIAVWEIWTKEEINKRKEEVEAAGMTWTVIESLPAHEDIKKQKGNFQHWVENYKQSLQNISVCGSKVVTDNFMRIFDWMHTNLSYEMADKSKAVRFEKAAFIAFDLFLKRPGAEKDYTLTEINKAKKRFAMLTSEEKGKLYRNT